jgi:intracellular septation protein
MSSTAPMNPAVTHKPPPGWLAPVIDYAPVAVFFLTYLAADLIIATAAMMAATAAVLVLSLALTRRVPLPPLIVAGFVGAFGALTLLLDDEGFVKLRPTFVYALFAVSLLVGLAFGRSLLKPMMSTAWPMDEAGWRRLTFRCGLFFLALGALNEIIRRFFSTDLWVAFDVFGTTGLTLLFLAAQWPLLKRHLLAEKG